MEFRDYYQILELERDASQDDVKRAYRKLARKYHPDVSSEADAEEKFKAVGEAYEVLKDPEKRAAYDQLGADWQAGQEFNAPPGWDAGFEFSGGGFTQGDSQAFSDFFESLFGQRFDSGGASAFKRGPRGYQGRGQDHHARIMIDLEDSLNGASRAITLRVPEVDRTGHVYTRNHTLNVKIPKGVAPGQQIRLQGQGDPGPGGGPAGDLYLEVVFKPHRRYRLEGRDIYLYLPVAPWEAALGATVKAPTPTGVVDLKIPAGSKAGKKMRIKGRGLPGKQAGDFYVVIELVLPPVDDDKVKQAYQDLARVSGFNPRADLGV
ncbi:MAG TPA: cytochrome C biogenesis protein [Porticoccaceae bacterium]|nr:cytochrome C biogenesis protein [Porticoccaceae bacterium]